MATAEAEKEALTPPQKELVKKADFTRQQQKMLDGLLREPASIVFEKERIMKELRKDYNLKDVSDDVIEPLARLRTLREATRKRLGLRSQEEEMELWKFTHVEPGETDKYSDFKPYVGNMIKYHGMVRRRIGRWVKGEVNEGILDGRIAGACETEVEYIKRLTFVEAIGGVSEYHKVPGMLTETRQTRQRFISDLVFSREMGIVFEGYNTHLDTDLIKEVSTRFETQQQVNILDSGCGRAGAFAELVQTLDKKYGNHTVSGQEGKKVIVFGNGKLLNLVGVSRIEFPHQDYINYIVSDIDGAQLTGPFDEIWDVFGSLTYNQGKKKLIEKYYKLLRKEGEDGGKAGTMRIATSQLVVIKNEVNKSPEKLTGEDAYQGGKALSERVNGLTFNLIDKTRSITYHITRREDEIKLPLDDGKPVSIGEMFVTGVQELYRLKPPA